MNIVILGPQGSGKGTQAELLAEKFNMEHIDMGKLLREAAKKPTKLGREIYNIQNVTNTLVPGPIVKKVLIQKLSTIPVGQSIVFDGVPRTLDQVKYLKEALAHSSRRISAVFFVKISEEESTLRLSKRWVCSECKAAMVMGKDIKTEADRCPHCGGKISQRLDDTPEGIQKRLAVYKEETVPVLDHFRKENLLIEINGEQEVEKVFKEISRHIT